MGRNNRVLFLTKLNRCGVKRKARGPSLFWTGWNIWYDPVEKRKYDNYKIGQIFGIATTFTGKIVIFEVRYSTIQILPVLVVVDQALAILLAQYVYCNSNSKAMGGFDVVQQKLWKRNQPCQSILLIVTNYYRDNFIFYERI